MVGSDPDAPAADPIPDDPEERQAVIEQLASQADNDPDAVTHDDLATGVALLSTDDPATRVAAAAALQHLHDRPSLFEPFVEDLVAAVGPYPDDVDGIPAPVEWMGSEAIRGGAGGSAPERPKRPPVSALRGRIRGGNRRRCGAAGVADRGTV